MIYHRKSCRSFTNVSVEGDNIHVYCSQKGSWLVAGIALAHLYVANEETFRFFKMENAPGVLGYSYIGSVTL